jgi:hypothetical protein|tara:strand:+ start:1358 stop:1504 length:147 start_codon:yes stop_codon:yes gene_type:complete
MKEYIINFTLNNGTKDSVLIKTDNINYSLEQFGRNRSIKSFDSVSLKL